VFATTPYPGALLIDSHRQVDCRNATYRRVVAQRPGTDLVDLHAYVERERAAQIELHEDAIHFSTRGARRVAGWLIPQVLALHASR
jgi:hypothetical protein